MTLKDLAVSFHFPKFSTSRDFYKAFGCRVWADSSGGCNT